jgi:hypothetical protein
MGTEWIGVSYEWRKAVFLATWEKAVFVVDLDRAAVTKSCKSPDPQGRSYITSWLADTPGQGPTFVWEEAGAHPIKDAVWQGMVLDRAIPCEKSFVRLDATAIRHAVAHGSPGIADIVNSDGVLTIVDENGTGEIAGATPGKRIPLGFGIPLEFLRGIERRGGYMGYMAINDSHAFVLAIRDKADRYFDFVFRKSDRTWHKLPRSGDYLRGFGRYIASTEVLRAANARSIPSAGIDKWKPGREDVRPDLKERLKDINEHDPISYPGRLHVYDIDTERLFTINTGQGDSEVLLIESGMVYYRAADQLFSGEITSRGIGSPRLLAADDSIRDAHWAFIKH